MTRPLLDLTLYLVTPCGKQRDEAKIVALCQAAVAGGASLIQLRDKQATTAQRARLAARIIAAIGPETPLVINDDIEAVLIAEAAGAHIGQDDMDALHARQRLGPDRLLGLSIHNDNEMDRALALPKGTLDYVGLGAVYPTTTKEVVVLGLAGLRHLVARAHQESIPCVAIGGITEATIAAVAATPVDGAAVVGAIAHSSTPQAATAALLARWQRVRQ